VPLALLDSVRATPVASTLALQAQILAGVVPPPRGDVADRIADDNHARVRTSLTAMLAAFDSIEADRATSYARVGISTCR